MYRNAAEGHQPHTRRPAGALHQTLNDRSYATEAGRSPPHERATAGSESPPISYLTLALCAALFSAAAATAEGSAKAITASPNSKLEPGLPPKP
jgi:hypothetical protein